MNNRHIESRLKGIHQQLMGAYKGGGGMPSASKGHEREYFVELFLSKVLPTPYRFGRGAVTDQDENVTGQLDVVVEYPSLPSLPLVGGSSSSRLYLAEGAAAIIEVKSDVANQWDEVVSSAEKVASLRRKFGRALKRMTGPNVDGQTREILDHEDRIPFFAVGYSGWKTCSTLKEKIGGVEKIDTVPIVDGVLVLDSLLFKCSRRFGGWRGNGAAAMWGLISCLEMATRDIVSAGVNTLHYTGAHPLQEQE